MGEIPGFNPEYTEESTGVIESPWAKDEPVERKESQGNVESGEKVSVENDRGQKLAAVIHRPRGEGKFPAVILLDGFTENKDEEHIARLAAELSQGGIAAVRFDYAGIGESEGVVETDYNFSNILSDTTSILKYLKEQDYVDTGRIGVWGHSMGATLSLVFASEHPEIKSLCAVAPVEIEDSLRQMQDLIEKSKKQGYIELSDSSGRLLNLPYSAVEDANRYNVGSSAEKIRQPVLIIAGKQDSIVPLEQSRSVYRKIRSKEKTLKEIPAMRHHYKHSPEDLVAVNREVISFFKSHL